MKTEAALGQHHLEHRVSMGLLAGARAPATLLARPKRQLRRRTLLHLNPRGQYGTSPSYDAGPELPAGTLIDGYLIERRVVEGAMASIYVATHPVLGRRVAIKVISVALSRQPPAVERFLGEAHIANSIVHEHVVDVLGFGLLEDGRHYFIMEWLEGESLARRIHSQGWIALPEAIDILIQMCDALIATHAVGVVHCDVKPDNILLVPSWTDRPKVKLFDFGVSKRMPGAGGGRPNTEPDMFLGTPHYSSPEQARGAPVDRRSDVYSLGVTAFEMLLGEVPFDGASIDVLYAQVVSAPPRPSTLWREIPPALERLLLAMLAKDASLRPSLSAVRAALVTLADLDQNAYVSYEVARDLFGETSYPLFEIKRPIGELR